MTVDLKPGNALINVVGGSEGPYLSIGDMNSGYRLSGPKSSCGGETIYQFQVSIEVLRRELDSIEKSTQ